MEYQNPHSSSTDLSLVQPVEQSTLKTFMANVFAYMFMALGISALFAYLFSTNISLLAYLIDSAGSGRPTMLGYIVMFSPIGFVLLMSLGFARLSTPVLITLFVVYSAVNGIGFSFILLAYTPGSILGCFLSAAAMFGVMAFMGYTTKQDLTKFGRIMLGKVFYGRITDVFQEQYSYFFFGITRFGWLHICKYAHKLINMQKGLILVSLFCQLTQYGVKKTLYSKLSTI